MSEFSFLKFCNVCGISGVPSAHAIDRDARLVLQSFIRGTKPSAQDIGGELISKAAQFFRRLNYFRDSNQATGLTNAQDACFSIDDHITAVDIQLTRIIIALRDVTGSATDFLRNELVPVWRAVKHTVSTLFKQAGIDHDVAMLHHEKRISPSDFGFHNCIVTESAQTVFIDFEQAGWDDPAKAVCDFFCSPEIPVPIAHFESFANAIFDDFVENEYHIFRTRLLIPVYRVKWACIQMQRLLPYTHGSHATGDSRIMPSDVVMMHQLDTARAMLSHASTWLTETSGNNEPIQ